MLYGLECFQLGKADLHSLDFTFNLDVVKDCQNYFATFLFFFCNLL